MPCDGNGREQGESELIRMLRIIINIMVILEIVIKKKLEGKGTKMKKNTGRWACGKNSFVFFSTCTYSYAKLV